MSDKYKITGEEINQILMHSPHALSLTPTERGMSGEQIKRYFYDFIRVFAEKLNTHLAEVGGEMESTKEALDKAQADAVSAMERADGAYGLASGKAKIHIEMSFGAVFGTLQRGGVNEGDIIMVTDKCCPDFVVASELYRASAVEITENMVVTGGLPEPKVGEIYYYPPAGKVIIAIESGIDASTFATIEYVDNEVGRVESIAKGANPAKVYPGYAEMIHDMSSLDSTCFKPGQNIYIETLGVPDLWVSEVRTYISGNEYTNDEDFVQLLKPEDEGGTGGVQVGYYILCALETQKVDLTEYPTTEDLNNEFREFSEGYDVYLNNTFATKEYVDSLALSGGGGTMAEAYELIDTIKVSEEAVVERKYTQRYKKLIVRAICDTKLPKFRLLGGTWFSEFYGFDNYTKTRAVYIGEIIIPHKVSETRCLTGDAGGNPAEYHTITGRLLEGAYFDGFKTDAACYVGTSIQVYGVKSDEN